jgi:Flp pilus assembly CpaF family ATPase
LVILKRSIIISGGAGTGKIALLNAVSSFIPKEEKGLPALKVLQNYSFSRSVW